MGMRFITQPIGIPVNRFLCILSCLYERAFIQDMKTILAIVVVFNTYLFFSAVAFRLFVFYI